MQPVMTFASHTFLVILVMIKVYLVTMETPPGEPCVFPFHYSGKTYTDCANFQGYGWCSTTLHYDGKWRRCDSASRWSVSYNPQSICALEGSTVDMSCSYTYPSHLTVLQAYWIKKTTPVTPELSQYRDRVKVNCSDKRCSITIHPVKHSDRGDYYCRIITNVHKDKRIGQPGVRISVTDLRVSSPSDSVREGDNVTLTCEITCRLTRTLSFTWSKDGCHVEKKQIINNQLQLHPVTYEDEGSYTCAVQGHEHLSSPSERLSVMYLPKNMQIKISPSGKITKGSHVTLTCLSEADPPVHTYTWIKRSGDAELKSGEGKTLTFSKIRSEDGGKYFCSAVNPIGQQESPAVSVQVLYPPKNTTVFASPSGVITKGSSVTLTCSSEANPPVENYTWFKKGTDPYIGSGQNLSISNITSEDGGHYYCEARNEIGAENSTFLSVTVEVAADPSPVSGPAVVAVFASVSVCLQLALVSACVWIRKGRESQRQISDDDAQYSNIGFQRSGGWSRAAGPPSADEAAGGAEDDVQYASVQSSGSGQTAEGVDDDVQYASVQFKKSGVQSHRTVDAYSSTLQPEVEPSVIYASLQHKA